MKIKTGALQLAVIMATLSCTSKQDTPAENRTYTAVWETFYANLSDPSEASQLASGLTGFNRSLLNNPNLFHLYIRNQSQAAANLGVYMADLNYCILFKKSDESEKYFNATYELSKVIGVEKSTLQFLMKRYEENLTQEDSVKMILQHLLEKSSVGIQGPDRERLAGIAIASYQIENLHLVLSTLESYPSSLTAAQNKSKDLLLNYIINQRGTFEGIYNFFRTHSDPLDPNRNPNYPFFDNALRELIGVYNNVTKENLQLDELKAKVDAIRTKIINP